MGRLTLCCVLPRQKHVVTAILLALLTPLAASALQDGPTRIGILGPAEEPRFSELSGGLKQGLNDLGYAHPALEILEGRVARGDRASAYALVEGFIQRRAKLIFVIGSELAKLAREVSQELPIVFVTPGDPVAAGVVASLAHPGGNTTAMTFEFPDLSAKRLELLKEMVPGVRRVLILYDSTDASPRQAAAGVRQAAPKLAITLVEREARSREEMLRGLEALGEADALLAIPGGSTSRYYEEIIRAAHARRLPTMFHARTSSTREALASYGAADVDIARQAARLVDKILKGAKAGDLPIERPTKLALVINLKTAKALGLMIPSTLLFQADEVIR